LSIDDGYFAIERFDLPNDGHSLGGVLFAEDFELPLPPRADTPAAAPPPPPPTEADVQASRALGFAAGIEAGLSEATARARLAQEAASIALAQCLATAEQAAVTAAHTAAETAARVILTSLAALLPDLSSAHGAAEAVALARDLLPLLAHQPRLALRANSTTLTALEPLVAAGRITTIAADSCADGDLTIEWQHGSAARDATAVLHDLRKVLAPLAPLGQAAAPQPTTAPPTKAHARELADA
jgi:hypothetical protein